MDKNKNKGVTLVELIIVTVLIAIMVVTGLQFVVYCKTLAVKSKLKLAAANYARETAEGLYWLDCYDNALNITASPVSVPLPSGELGDQYGGTRTYNVTGGADYKVVTVTVHWDQ